MKRMYGWCHCEEHNIDYPCLEDCPKCPPKLTEREEVACLRAVLERILRVMDEGLFVDYQLEKGGRIVKNRKKEV